MPDKIKAILDKILAWWNKFTAKQKTLIIGLTAAVVFTFVFLIYIFTKPQYIQWQRCSTTAEAAEVTEILDSNSIDYKVSQDGLNISVRTKQLSSANLALGAAGYIPDGYSIDDVLGGGLGSTQADVQLRWQHYLEQQFASDICSIESVKSATVRLHLPEQTGLLIDSGEESSAWIQLTLRDKFTSDQATTVARAVATALGNTSTANITIVDNNANLLFSGEEDYSQAGIANNMMELRSQAETLLGADVKKVLVGSKQFDMVEVACNLDIDFAEYERTIHSYSAPDDRTDGLPVHEEIYSDSNVSGVGGLPGTDSNDELTYQFQAGNDTESSSNQHILDFVVDESITVENLPPGVIDYTNSSLALTALQYRIVKEEDVRSQGLLSGMSWSEYKANNSGYTRLDVDEDFYSLVAHATGIPQENITIIAYETPQFVDREGFSVNATDVMSVVLIVIILALLALVVIRSMLSRRETSEEEEELSVENLLQSTPESTLEDIELETKSETRKLIEKFVDENPEAVANLLRNWLSEDWG